MHQTLPAPLQALVPHPLPAGPPVVLLAEADRSFRSEATRQLRAAGLVVLPALDATFVVETLELHAVDLVVLNLDLPLLGGLVGLAGVRGSSDVPVVVLADEHSEHDCVSTLDAGADDYLARPYTDRELVARCRARLRRPGRAEGRFGDLRFGPLIVGVESHRVELCGVLVPLTAREYALLLFMAQHPGRLFSREDLLTAVWGNLYQEPATVTEHVRRVRLKLGDAGATHDWIVTLRGSGYRFDG